MKPRFGAEHSHDGSRTRLPQIRSGQLLHTEAQCNMAPATTRLLSLLALLPSCRRGQPPRAPPGIEAAAAMEKVLVEAIARSEKSVVAIARVRKEQPGEAFQLEFRPDPFGRRPGLAPPPQPTDPNFVPNEYGSRRGGRSPRPDSDRLSRAGRR